MSEGEGEKWSEGSTPAAIRFPSSEELSVDTSRRFPFTLLSGDAEGESVCFLLDCGVILVRFSVHSLFGLSLSLGLSLSNSLALSPSRFLLLLSSLSRSPLSFACAPLSVSRPPPCLALRPVSLSFSLSHTCHAHRREYAQL